MDNIAAINEHLMFNYFDGFELVLDLSTRTDIWLSSTDYQVYSKSYIELTKDGQVKFYILNPRINLRHRTLSTYLFDKTGIYYNDLVQIALAFNMELVKFGSDDFRISARPNMQESLQIIFEQNGNDFYAIIFSVSGGRGPEYFSINHVGKVMLSAYFQKRYFNIDN